MAARDRRVITVRRSTVVRVGVAALVLVATGVGVAIGFAIGSKSSPPRAASTTSTRGTTGAAHGSDTTPKLPVTSTTIAAVQPAVLSCGPGSTPTVRPTTITVGCATGSVTVTSISWTAWSAATGGQATGTLNVNNCQPNCASGTSRSTAAIVVVFHAVNGIFQDVSITPSQNLPASPKTTSTAPLRTASTIPLTTTSTSSGFSPVAASQPGSGWGGH